MWFCEKCNNPLHEATMVLKDIGTQIKQAIGEFMADEHLRTCKKCGYVMEKQ